MSQFVDFKTLEQLLDEARADHAKQLSAIVALFSQQLAAQSGHEPSGHPLNQVMNRSFW